VPSEDSPSKVRSNRVDVRVRVIARRALLRLLEPLVAFVLKSGLSMHELNSILREAAVRTVAAKQLEFGSRINISGIAASTGIPRAEISRILKSRFVSVDAVDRQQQSTSRILTMWYQDPKFNTASGKPADLKIYGRGATFDSLVKIYGRGIPTRAILDELVRLGAAEVLKSGSARAKTSVAVDRGMTPRVVQSFGQRATELLSTMLQNMVNPNNPHFIASISDISILQTELPLFRKELASKGSDFLADLLDSMNSESPMLDAKKSPSSAKSRVGVTIFYHEKSNENKRGGKSDGKKRRNFRRAR
jgi:Family of unknown function (DUF6502)